MESRGYCAIFDGKQWRTIKIGLPPGSELYINQLHAESLTETQDMSKNDPLARFCGLDQMLISHFRQESPFPDGFYLTEKVDGSLLVVCMFTGELAQLVYESIMDTDLDMDDDAKDMKFVRTLAEESMKTGVLIVIGSNSTFITPPNMVQSIITAMATEFAGFSYDKTREMATHMNPIKLFTKHCMMPFIDRMMTFYQAGEGPGDPSSPFCVHFEVCNEHNRTAWGEPNPMLASRGRNAFKVLSMSRNGEFFTHGQFEDRIEAANLDQPGFWKLTNPVEAFEMVQSASGVIKGELTEEEFYVKHPPHNKFPPKNLHLQPEGFVVLIVLKNGLRYFKLKCQEYYWAHKPCAKYLEFLNKLPPCAANYFPSLQKINKFSQNVIEFIPELITFVKQVIQDGVNDETLLNRLPPKSLKSIYKCIQTGETAAISTAQKIIANSLPTQRELHIKIREKLTELLGNDRESGGKDAGDGGCVSLTNKQLTDPTGKLIHHILMNVIIGKTGEQIAETAVKESAKDGKIHLMLFELITAHE